MVRRLDVIWRTVRSSASGVALVRAMYMAALSLGLIRILGLG
jgi:hypothetical protein